ARARADLRRAMTGYESRLIAALVGDAPGPTLIIVGGIHGNEPAGIAAARRTLGQLTRADVRGEVIALIGNLRAGAAGRRSIAHDLNRLWTAERMAVAQAAVAQAAAMPGGAGASDAGLAAEPELFELVELSTAIDRAIQRARGPIFVLDCHTTSAAGYPFAVVGPTPEHRQFAEAFPLPGIVGLEEALVGTLTSYFGRRCVTLAVEGGQHASTEAADNLAAAITIALEATGIAVPPDAAAARAYLEQVCGELPGTIEVVSRHAIRPEHAFRMEPGFANIHRTPAGTLLARDRGGEIRAPFDGLVLLPLYQADGTDGFFYGRPA
ncbi:MAG TPA: succinylglutamate desuccinylase/aspartoacylase family protein, partial [Kofleriaceae bacterium]|nr:succinylglutamate desuccinylase/aspartoacylase family protein [Kofleriaceae bacterium]